MSEKLSRRQVLTATVTMAATSVPLRAMQESGARLPRNIQVGIIGLEGHYSEILQAAKILPQVQVTAVAEKDPALLRRALSNALLSKAKSYDDYQRLLDREQLDVVAVCGENSTRAAIVQICAERKLPIVAEKPLAITLEQLQAVKHKITASGVPLTMLLPMRFDPQYQAMRAIVDSGQIGDVISIAAQKSYKLGSRPAWMKLRKTYGGTIPYIGIHMVDLMRWVSRREFVETAAFQSNVGSPEIGEMENNTAMIFRLDNRGTASLRMDYLRPQTAPTHGDDRLRIAGSSGVVEYQEGGALTLITATQQPTKVSELPPARLLFIDFLDSIYNGKKHLITPAEIYRVTEIVLKTREAADSGRIVRL